MKQDHLIQKVFVEINVNNKEKALGIKEDINSFLSVDVFPKIEKYINALGYKLTDQTLQISRLELDLNVKNSALDTELKDKITELFKEELSEIIKPLVDSNQETENSPKAHLIDNQEKWVQTFIYFLEKGYMPWWKSDTKDIHFLETSVFDNLILAKNFKENMTSVLSKPNVQERIINQLSNKQIAQLCLTLLENKELKINTDADVVRRMSNLSPTDRITVWCLVLNIVSEYLNLSADINLQEYLLQQISKIEITDASQTKNTHQSWKTVAQIFPFISENEIFENIENIDNIKNNTTDVPKNAKTSYGIIDQKNTTVNEDVSSNDGQYIQNAGLVLIHPFIKTLFEHCDLLHPKSQQLLNPELGVHLLHYIATGKTNAPEYDMVFEKFLCNIPLSQTINRHIKLSRKHKAQANKVIESVQHNWNPMKTSSVALLRNEFFQRSGKLVVTDHDYSLTVERKTQDILLDKLTWGIGLIKLPWQKKFLFVNW